MRPEQYSTSKLVQWLEKERILTLDRVAEALGRPARITLFRKLAQLGSRASYSHGGRYHTLDRIADYDEDGLWSFRGVQFSQHGTLGETIVSVVEDSEAGCFASELQTRLQVRVHNAPGPAAWGRSLESRAAGRSVFVSVPEDRCRATARALRAEATGPGVGIGAAGGARRAGPEHALVADGPGRAAASAVPGTGVAASWTWRRSADLPDEWRQCEDHRLGTATVTAAADHDGAAPSRGGRPPAPKKTEVIALLDEVMQADTAGDPTSDQKWSRKDTRSISQQMQERGLAISPKTVGQLLKDQNYALRVNRKSIAQTQHPERNRQFELIEDFRKQFEDADAPILSLDTKKEGTHWQLPKPGTGLESRAGRGQSARFPLSGLGPRCPLWAVRAGAQSGHDYHRSLGGHAGVCGRLPGDLDLSTGLGGLPPHEGNPAIV